MDGERLSETGEIRAGKTWIATVYAEKRIRQMVNSRTVQKI